ncbi:hypothetical protein OAJ44_02720 [Chloroflexi bacterium]|nr:hypothetical protein [Chloroflexota bacterium]
MLDRIDRYELKEQIGGGGLVTVYLPEDTVLERQVAVKVMNQILSEEEAFADRINTTKDLKRNQKVYQYISYQCRISRI